VIEPVAFGVMFYIDPHGAMDAINAMPANVPVLADRAMGEQWLRWFVEFWNGPGSFDALPERMRAGFLATLHVCHGEVYSLLHDRTPARTWSTIGAPSLFLRGEKSPASARMIAQIISHAMSDSSLHDVPGAGHMSPLTHGEFVANKLAAHITASDSVPAV
jgi:pimeloyl-ACP methyl ester carboxylesterase